MYMWDVQKQKIKMLFLSFLFEQIDIIPNTTASVAVPLPLTVCASIL